VLLCACSAIGADTPKPEPKPKPPDWREMAATTEGRAVLVMALIKGNNLEEVDALIAEPKSIYKMWDYFAQVANLSDSTPEQKAQHYLGTLKVLHWQTGQQAVQNAASQEFDAEMGWGVKVQTGK